MPYYKALLKKTKTIFQNNTKKNNPKQHTKSVTLWVHPGCYWCGHIFTKSCHEKDINIEIT